MLSSLTLTQAAELKNLKVEYASCPIGIDTGTPRFSWQIKAGKSEFGIMQKAYRLKVYAEDGTRVWDSGTKQDDSSLNIEYGGSALQPRTCYRWELDAWTNEGTKLSATSRFETGLMVRNDADKAWNGAKWIGGGSGDMVLYSHYLPVFRLDYVFRLDSATQTVKTAFTYGANDERLMNAGKNIFGLASKPGETYIKVELDADSTRHGQAAKVRIYRAGYCPDDNPDRPLAEFDVPAGLFNKDNMYGEHTLRLTNNLGHTCLYLDNEEKEIGYAGLNPIGQGGDFIAFPVVGDVGFCRRGDAETAIKLEIRNYRSPGNILATVAPQETRAADSSGMRLTDPSRNASPMVRTAFSTKDKRIAKARLYVTARGIYDFYINGRRVNEGYFNPGLTQYNKSHMYQTYDVTPYIRNGRNAAGAVMAEGWWSGGITFTGENWNYFGDRQSVLAQIVITYDDGETENIVTSPGKWKFYGDGPVTYGSLFQGEVYDARRELEVKGWSTAEYDDTSWKPAQEVALEGTASHDGGWSHLNPGDYSQYRLTGQTGQGATAVKELAAQSVEEVRPGVFVYDMGQNMVGVPRIELSGCRPGQRISMRYAEVRYPDMPEYAGLEGMLMLENIRAAMAQDVYIARGGKETVAPRFTCHGYRFVEITGIDRALPLASVKGTVISSVDSLMSSYETSNSKVNRLWRNIVWSTYGNFLSIPTDCPQRNERMGWMGDISVFSRTATYLADAPQFLRRYLLAVRDLQREDGRFEDIAPIGGGFGGMLWGSAGVTVPWECYVQYGDRALLEEHYPAMKRYVGYLLDKCVNKQTNVLDQGPAWWGNLGDWLGPEDGRNDGTLLWDAYFIYDLSLMSRMAAVLGNEEDSAYYARLRNERAEFFCRTYIDPETGATRSADGKRTVDTQTSYVLPLVFDIAAGDLRKKVAERLANTLTRANKADNGTACPPYSLMTGFIGTAWISKALSDAGLDGMAYRLLQQTEYPSWLYPVEQGATTIWERLNSYTQTDGFGGNNRMNSFNHYSFGAVGSWMYNYSLGIQPDEHHPGFKHFFLKPTPDPTGKMTYARGHYDSVYGRIESGWEIMPKSARYSFTVPANTTATVIIPCPDGDKVTVNGEEFKNTRDCRRDDGRIEMEVLSGTYLIETTMP